MLWRILNKRRPQAELLAAATRRGSAGLQVVLWTVWTLLEVAVAYVSWHADIVAQRPINIVGLVIHCVLAGVIGLVVMTKIEMYAEPWRFMDDD